MKTVEIKIIGGIGSGKPAIGAIIKEALEKHGITVDPSYTAIEVNIEALGSMYDTEVVITEELK